MKNNFSSEELIKVQLDDILKEFQSEKAFSRMMELEGECKIEKFTYMRINYIKAIPLTFFLILSFFGLFVLKYNIKFRKMVFYCDCNSNEATHVHVESSDSSFENRQIEEKKPEVLFTFQKVRYCVKQGKAVPNGFHLEKYVQLLTQQNYLKNGLIKSEVPKIFSDYGPNEHKVDAPNYFEYMLDKMTTPFFILQYIFCISYILTGFAVFGIALISLSIITTSINYVLLYFSYLKIAEMAQRNLQVKVIREGEVQSLPCRELVPGDLLIPQGEVPCDALMIQGSAFVNEANLTGESNPVGKFSMTSMDSIYEHQSWLYQGSTILEMTKDPRAVVVNTGFLSLKGRIIRRILTRQIEQPSIYMSALTFLTITFSVGIVAYGAYIAVAKANGIQFETAWYVIIFFDIISSFIPSPLPIYFNLNYSFSLARLRYKGITGTQSEKTVVGAHTKIMCFDKTGTLTQPAVTLKKIIRISGTQLQYDVQNEVHEKMYPHILELFATCHSTREIQNQFYGDEMDKEIFGFSGYKLISTSDESAIFSVECESGEKLDVLRVNQFQSRFQSMSVLIRNNKSRKLYVYIKGAPEKLYNISVIKPLKFFETIEKLSLQGYRTIGIGFKEIDKKKLEDYMKGERSFFEENIELLGLVGFQNKVKEQAFQTINNLNDSNIECKIITGDNIFIGVQTAIRVGIIGKQEQVLILEGKDQVKQGELRVKVISKENDKITYKQKNLSHDGLDHVQSPIAVDNDFLSRNLNPSLIHKIKIFGRIPPQNKASVIKKLKQEFIREEKSLTSFEKLFNMVRPKVGMCGDGANDLLALRQADLSLGLQATDASYGSSFSIKQLSDVDEVIRESKSAVSNLVHVFQLIISTFMASRVGGILMISNAADHSSTARVYYNFASLLTLPLFIPLSKPTNNNTHQLPNPNFMQLGSQLVVWGNTFFCLAAMVGGYLFFRTTPDFHPTTRDMITLEDKPSQDTTDNTVLILIQNLLWTFSALLIFWSPPWKLPIYHNIPLFVLFLLNVMASTAFFFITPHIADALSMEPISISTATILLAITTSAILINALYQWRIHALDLHAITI